MCIQLISNYSHASLTALNYTIQSQHMHSTTKVEVLNKWLLKNSWTCRKHEVATPPTFSHNPRERIMSNNALSYAIILLMRIYGHYPLAQWNSTYYLIRPTSLVIETAVKKWNLH